MFIYTPSKQFARVKNATECAVKVKFKGCPGKGARHQKPDDGLARELGVSDRVRFHRALADDDLVRCYQQCDLFVLPNRQVGDDIEGFGMVLLEAQACGKPVLAGASGGTAETMRPGETGELVDCTTPHLLAAKVSASLLDGSHREQIGLAARSWVTGRFDWPMLAAEAAAIHAEILMDIGRFHTPSGKASR